jgi:curved DNA-binding protein CbpA
MSEYYKILDISQNATIEEIKYAYRKLAKLYHPDRNKGNDEKFKRLSEAYSTLINPKTRKEYDQECEESDSDNFYESRKNEYKGYRSDFTADVRYKNQPHDDELEESLLTINDFYFAFVAGAIISYFVLYRL